MRVAQDFLFFGAESSGTFRKNSEYTPWEQKNKKYFRQFCQKHRM
jgi:hypothetical protein